VHRQRRSAAAGDRLLSNSIRRPLYICVLLVETLCFPRSHDIKFLRSLAEDKDPRLVAAWPRSSKVNAVASSG